METIAPGVGIEGTLLSLQRAACESCYCRKVYSQVAGVKPKFSFEECTKVKTDVGNEVGADRLKECGLAGICVGLAAREGELNA